MIWFRNFPLLALVCISCLTSSFCSLWKYEQLERLNASCYPKDTCNAPRDLDDLSKHNCDCSSLCSLYRTCCIDSPFLNITHKVPQRRSVCQSPGYDSDSAFMIDTCSHTYSESIDIKRKCEEFPLDQSDPFVLAPVTNPRSQTTYKSLFCAICNYEKPADLTMWQIMLDCSPLNENMQICTDNREFVLKNIIYLKEKDSWGLWSFDKKSDWKFRYLSLSYKLPIKLKEFVQECRPNLISDCAPDWTDNYVKKMCKTYMGAVYFPTAAFRNIHCAICNYVKNATGMSCHRISESTFKSPTALSFGLLVDLDPKDGDNVGRVDKCSKGKIYDPFAKTCRSLECPIPGYELKDGRCERTS